MGFLSLFKKFQNWSFYKEAERVTSKAYVVYVEKLRTKDDTVKSQLWDFFKDKKRACINAGSKKSIFSFWAEYIPKNWNINRCPGPRESFVSLLVVRNTIVP